MHVCGHVGVVLGLAVVPGLPLAAQSSARPIPYPVTPPQNFQRALDNGTRSATGAPGPTYWQNGDRYEIKASLYPEVKRLDGREHVVYYNRSPDTLSVIYLHVYQNLNAPGVVRNEAQEVTGGARLKSVVVDGTPLREEPDSETGYSIDGTVMRLNPPHAVPPHDSIVLDIAWGFRVPQRASGRMGWSDDNLFFVAYWYPRICVYDDVVGWQHDPYLGLAEFYDEYGDYDYTVDVPQGWVIVGTGELQNPTDVLPASVIERLQQASQSDSVVAVLTASDLAAGRSTRSSPTGRLTWRLRAHQVRDVAFSATRASLWDAARTSVGDRDGDGKPDFTRVDALYRTAAVRWRSAARYAQQAIRHHSRYTGFSYAWSHATAVEGAGIIGGGMEFPMMTLIGDYTARSDSQLYSVVAHELAHEWVPMTVGTDETRYGWMDEGTTTFNENHAASEFFPGYDADRGDQDTYVSAARSGNESPMMRWTNYLYPGQNGVDSYSKPASVLVALRGMLGDSLFLRAYHAYFQRWAFKHPKPWDFFNTFNDVTQRNLDWFWRSWYYETWTLDQTVGAVRAEKDGTQIVIEDKGLVPMPARVTITLGTGRTMVREIPVETWLAEARTAVIHVPKGSTVAKVEIDADHAFPDVDRSNNVWPPR
jgi:hypothetical protein